MVLCFNKTEPLNLNCWLESRRKRIKIPFTPKKLTSSKGGTNVKYHDTYGLVLSFPNHSYKENTLYTKIMELLLFGNNGMLYKRGCVAQKAKSSVEDIRLCCKRYNISIAKSKPQWFEMLDIWRNQIDYAANALISEVWTS